MIRVHRTRLRAKRPNFARRTVSYTHLDVYKRQEDHVGAVAVVAGTGIGRLNIYRATEQFRSQRQIQSVQPLVVVARPVFRHGHHINRAVRTLSAIDRCV